MNEHRLEKGEKREFGANAPSFLVQKGREKQLFRLKLAIGKYRRVVFFLIVLADTIRLSAGILIAFENSLIVFMNSLIEQSRAGGLAKRTVYCKLDFKRFSEL